MQPILIRGLRRSFSIDDAWTDTTLAYLRTTPEIFGAAPAPEPIAIEPAGMHYGVQLPAGPRVEGSLHRLAFDLDQSILRLSFAAEAETLLVPAAVLRSPNGVRSAFVGGRISGKTWLSLSLLAAGWSFEGDGWMAARWDGVIALPRTLRLRATLRSLPRVWRDRVEHAPRLRIDDKAEIRAIDPRIFGRDWTLRSGPLAAILFLEVNPGGRAGFLPLDEDRAFQRVLNLCHGRMTGSSAAALRKAIAGARNFRLRIGRPEETVESVMKVLAAADLDGIPR